MIHPWTKHRLLHRSRAEKAVVRAGLRHPHGRGFALDGVVFLSELALERAKQQPRNARGQAGTQAVAQHLEARAIEAVQTRLWMEAVDAHLDGNEKLARFYTDRFTDELKPAYEKWIALKPFENPAAPPYPSCPASTRPASRRKSGTRRPSLRVLRRNPTPCAHRQRLPRQHRAPRHGAFLRRHSEQVRPAPGALVLARLAIALFLYAAVRMIMLPVA